MRQQLAAPALAICLGYVVSALFSWSFNMYYIEHVNIHGPWSPDGSGTTRSSWRPAWTDLREVWEDVNDKMNHLTNISSISSQALINSHAIANGFPLPARLLLTAVTNGAHTAQLAQDVRTHPLNARILHVPHVSSARSLNAGYICVAVSSCCRGWAVTERLLQSLSAMDDPIHVVLVDDDSKVLMMLSRPIFLSARFLDD